MKTNTLYVSCGESEQMHSSSCIVENFNWITSLGKEKFEANVKLRYRQPDQATNVAILDDKTISVNIVAQTFIKDFSTFIEDYETKQQAVYSNESF